MCKLNFLRRIIGDKPDVREAIRILGGKRCRLPVMSRQSGTLDRGDSSINLASLSSLVLLWMLWLFWLDILLIECLLYPIMISCSLKLTPLWFCVKWPVFVKGASLVRMWRSIDISLGMGIDMTPKEARGACVNVMLSHLSVRTMGAALPPGCKEPAKTVARGL